MITMIALFALACQDRRPPEPPRPPEGGERRPRERDPQDSPEARERAIKDLEKRAEEVQARLDALPEGSPQREELVTQVKRIQAEIRRLRDGGQRPGEAPGDPRPPRGRGESPEPPRPGDGRDGPPRFRPVENPDAVRAWLEKNEPETYQRMMRAQEEGRRPEVMQILSEAEPRMRLKESDPKAYERTLEIQKLDRSSMELAERARRAAPEERERVSKQLVETLQKLFDLREENRASEVAELKRRVDALEKELAKRKANRERIVDWRRRELLGEKGEFDW